MEEALLSRVTGCLMHALHRRVGVMERSSGTCMGKAGRKDTATRLLQGGKTQAHTKSGSLLFTTGSFHAGLQSLIRQEQPNQPPL